MSFPSWLRNLRSALAPARDPRRHGRRGGSHPAATHRPNLEVLEDRRQPSLNAVSSLPVGAGPLAVATADFDNDGRLDLATANSDAGTVSVLLGDGQGGFGAANDFATGVNPMSVAAGDFNNDGNLDLATLNQGDHTVSVLLGDGDGTFRPPVRTAILPGPEAVAAADFNGDGDMDLVYGSSNQNGWGSIEVLAGDGRGGFAARHRYDVRTWNPAGLAVADLNADGRPDVVTANAGYNGSVSVLLGNGDGTLSYDWSASNFAAGSVRLAVAVGDFTGDGIPDVVAAGEGESSVDVLTGRGDGTFAARISSVAPIADSLAAADFNGDGHLDVLTTDRWSEGGAGTLLLGRGDGSFYGLDFVDNVGAATGVAVGDFNGDGRPDAAVTESNWNTVSVLLNDAAEVPLPPSLRITDATVTEGNTGTVAAIFTVTLSAASTETITVAYETGNGTAAAGSDYQAASGTLTIPTGQTTGRITVPVIGDRLAEENETFFVNVTSATNATIADGQGLGTIADDEPRISISDVSKAEGKKRQTTIFTFTVTLSAAYDQAVTMSYRTADGTAKTSDGDYVARTGTLTFAPGETTKTVTIEVKGDSTREADEYFYLDLYGLSSNGLFTKSRGLGTILNDD